MPTYEYTHKCYAIYVWSHKCVSVRINFEWLCRRLFINRDFPFEGSNGNFLETKATTFPKVYDYFGQHANLPIEKDLIRFIPAYKHTHTQISFDISGKLYTNMYKVSSQLNRNGFFLLCYRISLDGFRLMYLDSALHSPHIWNSFDFVRIIRPLSHSLFLPNKYKPFSRH